MSYKPTHEEWIAYLYDELEEEEKARIKAYLNEHPEAQDELESLENTRLVMSRLDDEAIPGPVTLITPAQKREWPYWRPYVAIAATLLLLLTFGWVSGLTVTYSGKGFLAGFGEINNGISQEEMTELMDQDRKHLLDWVQAGLKNTQDSLEEEIRMLRENYQASLEQFENPGIADVDISGLFDEQKQELVSQVTRISEKLTDDYRELFRQLMVSFSNNWESQRIDDLRTIEAAFNNLEATATGKQQELEDALYHLTQEVNTLIQSNNNNK